MSVIKLLNFLNILNIYFLVFDASFCMCVDSIVLPVRHMFCQMASLHLQAPHNEVTYELNHDFFAINADTGVIRLKRSLWGSSTEVFRVTFILC